jgi:4-hydroxyphenylacetate 3-hydroxylase N terminal
LNEAPGVHHDARRRGGYVAVGGARAAARLISWEATMLMTGKEYLDSIRDGRRVYIGGELVEDVTAHPAFRNAAQSFAMIYDRKRDPENREPDDVRGEWRSLLDLFLAAADA